MSIDATSREAMATYLESIMHLLPGYGIVIVVANPLANSKGVIQSTCMTNLNFAETAALLGDASDKYVARAMEAGQTFDGYTSNDPS